MMNYLLKGWALPELAGDPLSCKLVVDDGDVGLICRTGEGEDPCSPMRQSSAQWHVRLLPPFVI